jgi:hypothetical protein
MGSMIGPVQAMGVGQAAVGARATRELAVAGFKHPVDVRPRPFLGGAVLILLVGFVLRVWNLGGASLWTDEVLTAFRAQTSLRTSLNSILASGNQTPLYFLSLRFWPNYTEILLRLPSALLGLLGIALLMFIIVRLYGNHELALWAGALLAVNPYHVLLSRTARPYALIFVLSLCASYSFLLLVQGRRTRMVWLVFVASSMTAYFAHYSALALFGAQYVFLVLARRRDRRLLRCWLGAQMIAAIPILSWLYRLLQQPPGMASEWIPNPKLRDIPLTLWHMSIGYDGVLKWYLVPGLMIVALGLVFGLMSAVRDRKAASENYYWFWLIGVPLIPVFLVSALVISFYVDRYFMVFLPALIILVACGWMQHPRWIWQLALGVVVLTCAYNVASSFYTGGYRRAGWREVATYVTQDCQPGDSVILNRGNEKQAFLHYLDEEACPALDVVVLSDEPGIQPVEQAARRVWVLYRNPNEDVHRQGVMPDFDPFQPGLTHIGDWLIDRRDRVVDQHTFNGVKVMLLDVSPAAGPALASAEP